MKKKRERGIKKKDMGNLPTADVSEHEQWRKAIEMRTNGASAKDAPMPTHPKEVTETVEGAEITETDGQWTVPIRLFKASWGTKIGIVNRFVESSQKVEECHHFFSPSMPNCIDVQRVGKQQILFIQQKDKHQFYWVSFVER